MRPSAAPQKVLGASCRKAGQPKEDRKGKSRIPQNLALSFTYLPAPTPEHLGPKRGCSKEISKGSQRQGQGLGGRRTRRHNPHPHEAQAGLGLERKGVLLGWETTVKLNTIQLFFLLNKCLYCNVYYFFTDK